MNHPNATCYQNEDAEEVCVADLESFGVDENLAYEKPDHHLILAFDNYNVDNSILYSENNYDHHMSMSFFLCA